MSIMLIMSCYTRFFNVRRGWQCLNTGPRFYLRLIRRTGWLWIFTSRTTDGRPFKPKKLSVPFLYPGEKYYSKDNKRCPRWLYTYIQLSIDYACQGVSAHRKPMALYRSPSFSFSVLFGFNHKGLWFYFICTKKETRAFREHVIAHLFFIWLLNFIELEANLNLYR